MLKTLLAVLGVVALAGAGFAAHDLSKHKRFRGELPEYVKTIKPQPGTDGMIAMIGDVDDTLGGSQLANLRRSLRQKWQLSGELHGAHDALSRFRLARRMLRDGETQAALSELHEIEEFAQGQALGDEFRDQLDRLIALSYLRLGEQQNCFANPHASACIIPLDPKAVHQLREGSTKAIEYYEGKVLKQAPDDYTAKWLTNIAHMTLGEYPDGVPAEHLVPMPGLIKDYDGPAFANVANFAGVADTTLSGAAVVDDFDNDGLLDLYTSSWGVTGTIRFYLRNADGRFRDHTAAAGLDRLKGGLTAIHADFDNDGLVDIYQMRGAWAGRNGLRPNSLLRNMGDGRFEDVTVQAGILEFEPTISSAFADLDNDGWLDLVVGNEYQQRFRETGKVSIFMNNRQGGFTRLPPERSVDIGCNPKGVAISDYDNDDFADIFISCQRKNNVLLRNLAGDNGGVTVFEDVTATAGVAGPEQSFSAWFFDFDNDGLQDLFVASYAIQQGANSAAIMARSYLGLADGTGHPVLYRNRGDGTFEDVSGPAGLGSPAFVMGANYGDFDNDGWLDMYWGTGAPDFEAVYPNVAMQNLGGRRFREISASSGLGHIQKGHGIAFADFDNDGDEDIFAEMGGARLGDAFQNALFENRGNENAWLKLKLEGRRSNRSAIGATIRVDVVSATGARRSIYRRVDTGGSFGSNPLLRHIGLGQAQRIERVEIYWPASGIRQGFDRLEPNQAYRIIEGRAGAQAMALPAHPLSRASGPVRGHDHAGH